MDRERATGSSILRLSKNGTAKQTITPAIAPMRTEAAGMTKAEGAVIAINPARAPLTLIDRSGFPNKRRVVMLEVTTPAAAARLVVTAIWAMRPGSDVPGLKPNHPSQRIKPPRVTMAMLWPGIGFIFPEESYFPIRGPRTMIPASPAQPPTE
jgi:hypothetical protein